jgi:hypothetical protein
MKVASLSVIFLLVILLLAQECKVKNLVAEVNRQKDSIETYHLERLGTHEKRVLVYNLFDKIKEPDIFFYTNDSIFERHRIIQQTGSWFRLIRIDCFKDSSIKLTLKTISLRNPLTGYGIDSLYKTHVQLLDKKMWLEFKNRLDKISAYDVTHYDGMLDCFGGELIWEAIIKNRTFYFRTHCNEAREFTETCEFLMRQIQDKELQTLFREKHKMRN